MIDCEQVTYLEADDHYTMVNYASGARFMVPFGLSRVELAIDSAFEAGAARGLASKQPYIVRLGRKYMVNTRRVFHINTVKQVVILVNGHGEHKALHLPKNILRTLIDSLTVGGGEASGVQEG